MRITFRTLSILFLLMPLVAWAQGNSYMSKYDSIKDSVGENLKAMIDKAKEA